MLQEFASSQSDSDLNFSPAFASLHRAWFQALFAIVQKTPLRSHTNKKGSKQEQQQQPLQKPQK